MKVVEYQLVVGHDQQSRSVELHMIADLPMILVYQASGKNGMPWDDWTLQLAD